MSGTGGSWTPTRRISVLAIGPPVGDGPYPEFLVLGWEVDRHPRVTLLPVLGQETLYPIIVRSGTGWGLKDLDGKTKLSPLRSTGLCVGVPGPRRTLPTPGHEGSHPCVDVLRVLHVRGPGKLEGVRP